MAMTPILLFALSYQRPATPLSASRGVLPVSRVSRSQQLGVQMIDQNVLIGGAVGLLGSLGGVALVAFTEKAGERTNARGALSNEQQQKFAGKFMEDVEADQSGQVDDVIAKMEAALGSTPTLQTVKEVKSTGTALPTSDGW